MVAVRQSTELELEAGDGLAAERVAVATDGVVVLAVDGLDGHADLRCREDVAR